ncbi:MAG: hypothetical protein PHY54_18535 [Methylococcales bacterium]|nr:hypothetical protein [Methylococcales bacterium]
MKTSIRYSLESLTLHQTDDQGRLFTNAYGIQDLTPVNIVGSSVDTVRQLFYGKPKTTLIDKLEQHAKAGESIISLSDTIGSQKWHFTRMGKVSRYRYKLQNNDEGIVILFCSFFAKIEHPGQHLKIELSPHFITQRSVQKIWQRLHGQLGLSQNFLEDAEPKGCAIHLACDYQGFRLPDDFLFKFSTRSRIIRSYDGMGSIDLSDLSDVVATYGSKTQTKDYLIGKVASMQFAAYDKSYEIIKHDKKDYFHREWNIYTLGEFDEKQTVRRIEARFHHSIIREIGLGMGKEFESFEEIAPYLTDIWRFGLEKNRLNLDDRHEHLHPFWQLLMEDVVFTVPATGLTICRKKKQSSEPIAKNLGLAVGNMLTIWSRQGFTVKQVMQQLRLLSFYPQLLDYYKSRRLTESDLREYVDKSLSLRRLIGKAA